MARIAVRLLLLAVLGMGLAWLGGRSRMAHHETVDAPAEPWSPETRFVETRSGRTHVLDVGEGDVILLTHGSGRSVADWQEGLAAALAETHRAIAFDNYGFGLSDRSHGWRYGNALWEQQAIDVLDSGRFYFSPSLTNYVVEAFTRKSGGQGSQLSQLTRREREVLQLIGEGLSTKEIAARLGVSPKTADSHRAGLMEKVGIHKSVGLVRLAIREGLVVP